MNTVEKQKADQQWSIGCFAVVLFVILYAFFSCRNYKPSPEEIAEGDKYEAWYYAQQFAKKELISPKSADFPSYHTDGVKVEIIGDDKFSVRGYVDAQNVFGAVVRSHFEAKISHEGKKWYLDSFRWVK